MNRRLHVGSILSAEQNQVKKPYVTCLTDSTKTCIGLINILLTKEYVWGNQTLFQHQFNRRYTDKHQCIDYTITQRGCFCGTQTCFNIGLIDVSPEQASVQWRRPVHSVRTSMATIWMQRDRLNRRNFKTTHRFFQWSRFFCSGFATAMWPSPLYIRPPPSSFMMPLTHWIPEATLEKRREEKRVLWAKRWRSRAWLCSKLEESNIWKCSKCACVAEPPKLSRLKCAGHHHKGNISLNALQTEQFLVCRVTFRYNHRFSDRTSIPRTKASSEILQPQFYNTGIVKITNQFKQLLQNQLK